MDSVMEFLTSWTFMILMFVLVGCGAIFIPVCIVALILVLNRKTPPGERPGPDRE